MNWTGSAVPPISNPEAGGLEPLRRALTRYRSAAPRKWPANTSKDVNQTAGHVHNGEPGNPRNRQDHEQYRPYADAYFLQGSKKASMG